MQGVSFVIGDPLTDGLLGSLTRDHPGIEQVANQPAQGSVPSLRDVVRVDPLGNRKETIVGVLRERLSTDVSEKFKEAEGTLGHNAVFKLFGDNNIVQMTMHECSSDPSIIDFFSYTFLTSRKKVTGEIPLGSVLEVKLSPKELLGHKPIWFASSVKRLM
ncbi:MAG: hypothetical protein HY680_04730 [Chloroflexi bacterium]|nr:hypothetical protein [Chloroflexota bacterium]